LELERLFLLFQAEKVFAHGLTDTVAAALPRLSDEIVGVEPVLLGVVVQEICPLVMDRRDSDWLQVHEPFFPWGFFCDDRIVWLQSDWRVVFRPSR
jgi:hypothetical protein